MRQAQNDCRKVCKLPTKPLYGNGFKKPIPIHDQLNLLDDEDFPINIKDTGRTMLGLKAAVIIPRDIVSSIGRGVEGFARNNRAQERFFVRGPKTKECEVDNTSTRRALDIFVEKWETREQAREKIRALEEDEEDSDGSETEEEY